MSCAAPPPSVAGLPKFVELVDHTTGQSRPAARRPAKASDVGREEVAELPGATRAVPGVTVVVVVAAVTVSAAVDSALFQKVGRHSCHRLWYSAVMV